MHRRVHRSHIFGASALSLAIIALPLSAAHAATDSRAGLSSGDSAKMLEITTGFLQERADSITSNSSSKARKTFASPAESRITAALAAKKAREAAALAQLRVRLEAENGGYVRAEVQVTPVTTTVNGDQAVVEVTEDARLYYPNVPAGDPEYEEYSVPHTMTFLKGADGGWLLNTDKIDESLTGPGPVTQLTEPASVPASDAESEGPLGAESSTDRISTVGDDKPLEPEATTSTMAAKSTYNYGNMVRYANKYWKRANSDYRTYGSDCTNFISQAMVAGGWKTTSGSIASRKDSKKWFYGSFELSTSYTWAGAENWYWFARKHSKRVKPLSTVWHLTSSDVLQADWKRDGTIDHTMIVTKLGKKGEVYLTYHTPSKHNVKLSTLLRKYPNASWYAHRT